MSERAPLDRPLLAVGGLCLRSRTGQAIAEEIGFALAPGEILAIVGESGSGKTMVARSILGLLPPGIERTAGTIVLDGETISNAAPARLRALRGAAIGMVFQEPMTSLNPALRVGGQMAEALAIHRPALGKREIRERCAEMLRRVGITDAERCLAAYPHEFSGGMRQRMMIASVMLLRPKLVIADEPTTALDSLTQREVLNLLVALTREEGTAVLLITHDLGVVARYAHRAIVLERGRLVEEGSTLAILSAPRHPYTRRLIEAVPRRSAARPIAADGGDPLLEVRDLVVTFRRRGRLFERPTTLRAVDGVSLALRTGEIVAVVGGSGSGKTTLGRAVLRLVEPTAGDIRFRGRSVAGAGGAALRPFRLAAQLVSQDPYSSLDPRMRVSEIVGEPLRHLEELDRAASADRVERSLEEVGLAGFGDRFPHQLSGGQRQRVAIARALIREPDLVVADEPISALDMTIQKQVLDLLAALQARRRFACLFISHDLAAVQRIADRVLVMHQGRIVETGPVDRLFERAEHPYTQALIAAAPLVELAHLAATAP